MKHIITKIAACILLAAEATHANEILLDYVGCEYKYSAKKLNKGWSNVLPKNHDNIGLFVGKKFKTNKSIEYGVYQFADNKRQIIQVKPYYGFKYYTTNTIQRRITNNLMTFNMDVNRYFQVVKRMNFILTMGLAATRTKIAVNNNFTSLYDKHQPIEKFKNKAQVLIPHAWHFLQGKLNFLPRVGLGFEYLNGKFGIRGRVLWEGSYCMHMDLSYLPKVNNEFITRPWQNHFSITLAVINFF